MELYYPDVLRMFCLFGYEAIFISNVSYPVIVKLNLAFITPDRIRFYKTDNFFLLLRLYHGFRDFLFGIFEFFNHFLTYRIISFNNK